MTDTLPTEVDAEIVDAPSSLDARIAADVATYSPTDATIAELAARFRGLSIDGIDDSEGEKAVRLARSEVRDYRTAVEKRRKALKADALAYGRAIDGEAKRITAALLEVEEPLAEELDAVKAERDRLAAEAEEAERAKMTARLDALQATGVTIAVASVQSWTDEEFADALREAQAIKAARDAEKAEAEAAAKAEAERVAAESKAIAAERAALEVEKAALQRAKDEAEAELRVREEAAAKLEREKAEAELRAKREAEQAARREANMPRAEHARGIAEKVRALGPGPEGVGDDYTAGLQAAVERAAHELFAFADRVERGGL